MSDSGREWGQNTGKSIVRQNLMTRPGYMPYCGAEKCSRGMPRMTFDGKQFFCICGWRSEFPEEFIQGYLRHWRQVEQRYVDGCQFYRRRFAMHQTSLDRDRESLKRHLCRMIDLSDDLSINAIRGFDEQQVLVNLTLDISDDFKPVYRESRERLGSPQFVELVPVN